MNYTFYIETISNSKYFCIKTNDPKYSSLGRFTDDNWTVTKIQNFINGINDGTSKPKGQEYIWASEDLTVLCNIHGVFLLDMFAQRAGVTDKNKLGLKLTHTEFLAFLNDFKTFVSNN